MTAFDFARSKATADRLITRFGQAGKIRRPTATGSGFDPTITTTDYSVTLTVLDYKNAEVDGERVLKSDKKVLLAKESLTIEPKLSDKLLIGGVAHAILDVCPMSPAGTVVYYELQVRR